MFLNKNAQQLINALREERDSRLTCDKASICDAMTIIMLMYSNHANDEEKEELMYSMATLSDYAYLLTELSKEE